MKFLIINDDVGKLAVLEDILQDTFPNAVFQTAKNNNTAFKRLEDYSPDIVITDLFHPPGEDGLAFLRQFRKESKWKSIPVICFSCGELTDEEKNEFDAFCSTSIQINELVACIKRFADLVTS